MFDWLDLKPKKVVFEIKTFFGEFNQASVGPTITFAH